MTRGVRRLLVSSAVLAALIAVAGCSHYLLAEREPWRHEAELGCLNAGVPQEIPGRVRVSTISGPGACGIDYPLKVAELGEAGGPLAYDDEAPRPPGAVAQPWSSIQSSTLPPLQQPASPQAGPPADVPQPYGAAPYGMAPYDSPQYGAAPYGAAPYGAAPYGTPPYTAPQPYGPRAGPPLSLTPSGVAPPDEGYLESPSGPPPYGGTLGANPAMPQTAAPRPPAANEQLPPPFAPSPPLVTAAAGPVQLKPAATLACPIVSALDKWVAAAVQPAALKWFRQPVVEIKQIGAYSCRGMNGNPNAHISEHAFGNALDIAEFDLADGHRVSVQYGWHGTPEEQGFLHDVQGAACRDFTTVLAPGANVYHYNHIHVDLMRRAGRPYICEPTAIPGDVAAARVRARYAGTHGAPGVTGSIAPGYWGHPAQDGDDLPAAEPGED